MRSHHIRTFGLVVGLIAVLGVASIAAGESLTDQQIGRQIERRLSEDAFSNVNVSGPGIRRELERHRAQPLGQRGRPREGS